MIIGETPLKLTALGKLQRPEIDNMKTRVRALEVQEMPFVRLATIIAKGDILAGTAPAVLTRLAVGANGYALLADSTQPTGLRWGVVLVDMPAATVKGRALGAGTGAPVDLTATQLNAIVGTVPLAVTGSVSTLGAASAFQFYDRATNTVPGIWYSPTVGDLRLHRSGVGDVLIYNADGLTLGSAPGVPDAPYTGKKLYVANPSNSNQYIGIGYDPTQDAGFILAVDHGINWKNLTLAAQGGNVVIGGWTATDKFNILNGGLYLNQSVTDYYAIRIRGASSSHLSRIQAVGDSNLPHSAIAFQQVTPAGVGSPTAGAMYLQTVQAGVLENTIQLYNRGMDLNGTGAGATMNVGGTPSRIANYTYVPSVANTSDIMEKYDFSGWDLRLEQEHIGGARVIYTWRHNFGGTVIPAITVDGWLTGLGTNRPQGRLHGWDGNGGWLAVTKINIDGTAQVIIPDGTGDVTTALQVNYVVRSSAGGQSSGTGSMPLGGGDLIIYSSGGNTLALRINANGSFDVRRTGGALTYNVNLFINWL